MNCRLVIHRIVLLVAILFFVFPESSLQAQTAFDVIPLGVRGGADESNLSSYAVASHGGNAFVCLDAGTVYSGVSKAIAAGVWTGLPGDVIRDNIKGYLISHPHLDHLAGLILNAPDDSQKPIYGISPCIDVIRDKYFSWSSWANFANEGEPPLLKKYTYTRLTPGTEVPLVGTDMHVTAFVLSHSSPQLSTAFLVRSKDSYLLYLGDTGDDATEKSDRLAQLWRYISPLVKQRKLKSIFIEISFPDAQPAKLLFGHLTPTLLMKELQALRNIAGNNLQDVSVVVTHMKPGAGKEEAIRKEVTDLNRTGLKIVFPEQTKRLEF